MFFGICQGIVTNLPMQKPNRVVIVENRDRDKPYYEVAFVSDVDHDFQMLSMFGALKPIELDSEEAAIANVEVDCYPEPTRVSIDKKAMTKQEVYSTIVGHEVELPSKVELAKRDCQYIYWNEPDEVRKMAELRYKRYYGVDVVWDGSEKIFEDTARQIKETIHGGSS